MPLNPNWRQRISIAGINGCLALVLRFYIGGLFIYASLSKINYTAEFTETIANYQLVPFWAVNLMAVSLPWAELICGLLMILGVRAKAAAAAIAALMGVFTVAIIITMIRGTPIGCGCFSSVEEPVSWVTVIRDLTWLAMTLHVYFFDRFFQLESKFILSVKDL